MNTLYIKFKILFSVIFLIFLSSCSDSGSLSDGNTIAKQDTKTNNTILKNETNTISSITIRGVLVDGYIAGATVCVDISKDERCSKDEPTTITNSKGEFSIKTDITENKPYIILASGGIDTAINAKFNSTYKAVIVPKQNKKRDAHTTHLVNITPLSTLTSNIFSRKVKENPTYQISTAIESVSKSLGLPSEKLLNDPLKDIEIFGKTQEIVQTIKIISSSMRTDETNSNAKRTFDFVMDSLSDTIENSEPTGKLEIPALVSTLQKSSFNNKQIKIPFSVSKAATTNVVNINKQITSLKKSSSSTESLSSTIDISQLASIQKSTQKQATQAASNATPTQTTSTPIVIILAPNITNATNKTFTSGTTIAPFSFTNSAGAIASCSISEALSSGLSFNTTTCMISGTPSGGALAEKIYTITATNGTGSNTATVSITINQAPAILVKPIIANVSDKTFTLQSAISLFGFPNTGGAIASCSISEALPNGLELNTSNCQISGTPINGVVAKKEYNITASNSAGSDTAIVNITINDIAPNIADISVVQTFTKDTAITPISFVNTAGAITGCEVTVGALPLGLSLNNSTCAITGTPTQPKDSKTYTITATNITGTSNATITIIVNNIAPNIADISIVKTFPKNTEITPINFINTGGEITSCSISDTLPTGLNFNPTTCEISGTPTGNVVAQKTYTITATNAIGSDTATVKIVVSEAVVVLTKPSIANTENKTFTSGTAITSFNFTNTGGAIVSCTISPALSLGLNFNTANCNISGTPSVEKSKVEHTITATNTAGSDTATVNITTISGLNSAKIKIFNLNNDFSAKNDGSSLTNTSWSFANKASALISPTPSKNITLLYTNAGTSPNKQSIAVIGEKHNTRYLLLGSNPLRDPSNDDMKKVLENSISWLTKKDNLKTSNFSVVISHIYQSGTWKDQTTIREWLDATYSNVSYNTATSCNGGNLNGCLTNSTDLLIIGQEKGDVSISVVEDALKDGIPILYIHSDKYKTTLGGKIYDLLDTTWSNNSNKLSLNNYNPSVILQAPDIEDATNRTFTIDSEITPLNFTNNGGRITSCSITNGTLPAGLILNSSSCEITGTPTEIKVSSTYTITATNIITATSVTMSDSATVNITINDKAPNMTDIIEDIVFVENIEIDNINFQNTAGGIESCSIDKTLPLGLNFNANNCQITGTPSEVVSKTTYTITAKNIGGESSATVSLSVLTNTGLVIYGVPKTSISAYNTYQFLPRITKTNTTFSITNKPSWATFNTSTGLLEGLTTSSDVGTYDNIVISSTDGSISVNLNSFSIEVTAGIDLAHKYGIATGSNRVENLHKSPSFMIDNDDATYSQTSWGGWYDKNWMQIEIPKYIKVSKIVMQHNRNINEHKDGKIFFSEFPYKEVLYEPGMNDAYLIGELALTNDEQVIEFNPAKSGMYLSFKGPGRIQGQGDPSNTNYIHFNKVEIYGSFENAPIFDSFPDTYDVNDSSAIGANIAKFTAKDLQNDTVSFTMSENTLFKLDTNGTLSVKSKPTYGTYTLSIIASDRINTTNTTVTINVGSPNIAHLYGKATQPPKGKSYSEPSKVIDNDYSTQNHTSKGPVNWVQIELPLGNDIEAIKVYNNTDQGNRLTNAKLYLLNSTYNGDISSLSSQTAIYTFDSSAVQKWENNTNISGRYVLLKADGENYLHVKEIEVYGHVVNKPYVPDGTFTVTIDKWHSLYYRVLQVEIKDPDNEKITYSIEEDVPFRVDDNGTIYPTMELSLQTYTFNVKGMNTKGQVSQEVSVEVINQTVIYDMHKTSDERPQLTGYLPNTYKNGNTITITINGKTYTANIHGDTWSISSGVIEPLGMGKHNISLQINGATAIVYENYFEVVGLRRQYKNIAMKSLDNIEDIDVTITLSTSAPLQKDEKRRATHIWLDNQDGSTILINNSYRTIRQLTGVYKKSDGKKQFVRFIFDKNIEPYSRNNLDYINSNNISIFPTAGQYDLEISFTGDICNDATYSGRRFCYPGTRLYSPASTGSVAYIDSNYNLSEQQVFTQVTATWNHVYNRVKGIKSIEAYVNGQDYEGMAYSNKTSIAGQEAEAFAPKNIVEDFFATRFFATLSPNNYTRYMTIRYQYAAGIASIPNYAVTEGSSISGLTGERSMSGWASAWESNMRLTTQSGDMNKGTYEAIGHEAMHSHGMTHESGLTYGWVAYGSEYFIPKYYTNSIVASVKAPKYVFDTKVLSKNSLEIELYKTTDSTTNNIRFDILLAKGSTKESFIFENTSANKVKLTFNDNVFPRFFIRVYGDDSEEFTSKFINQEMMLGDKIGQDTKKKYYLFSYQDWEKISKFVGYSMSTSDSARACRSLLGNSGASVANITDVNKIQSSYREVLDATTWSASKKFYASNSIYDYGADPYTTSTPTITNDTGLICVVPMAIEILGTPITNIYIDSPSANYSFAPTMNKNYAYFMIENKPSWLEFNTSNGALKGVSSIAGTYNDIKISARYDNEVVSLDSFNITVNDTPNIAISGMPDTNAYLNTPSSVNYSFTPTINRNNVVFEIENKPDWLVFDTSNGNIRGTPTAIGDYDNITISAIKDGTKVSLSPFSIKVNYSWKTAIFNLKDDGTAKSDGSSLTNIDWDNSTKRFRFINPTNANSVTLLYKNANDKSLAIIGEKETTRYLAMGSNPFRFNISSDMEQLMENTFAWLTRRNDLKTNNFSVVTSHLYQSNTWKDQTSIREWLTSRFGDKVSYNNAQACNNEHAVNCLTNDTDLLIVGQELGGSATNMTLAINKAIKNGIPIFYMHSDHYYYTIGQSVAQALDFTVPAGDGNFKLESYNPVDFPK